MEPVLSMRGITKSFFGSLANDRVNLDVYKAEIHALLGENGAGKTTLMNILYGIYQADSGEIFFKGKKISFTSPKDAIECKIGMVHQHFALVNRLTVSENITLGLKEKGYPFTDRSYIDSKLNEISTKYGLLVDPKAKISSLSVGEQQRVEIMKLLYRETELLILDEPTAVLTPKETKDFFSVLRKLKEDGKSIIIITHRIPEVMEIADTVTVLRDGKNAASFDRKSLSEETLAKSMIGRELKASYHKEAESKDNEIQLEIDGLEIIEHKQHILNGISLKIRKGEILGIAGVDGNGQKPLAEAIVGIRPYTNGSIKLSGESLDGLSVEKRKKMGIGYISDDRHKDGLLMDMDLMENMILRSDKKGLLKHGIIDFKTLEKETERAKNDFAIKTHSLYTPVRLLSGGNQQKLILAREIYDGIKLVIAFQPTRGLDIGASESVRELLVSYRSQGCSVLLISADLDEIFSISDRVAVIHSGSIMGEVVNDKDVDMTAIGLMMAGRRM